MAARAAGENAAPGCGYLAPAAAGAAAQVTAAANDGASPGHGRGAGGGDADEAVRLGGGRVVEPTGAVLAPGLNRLRVMDGGLETGGARFPKRLRRSA